MALLIFLALIGVPVIEIAVFIEIGGRIGLWSTVGLIVLTALIGTALLRHQGLSTLARARASLNQGKLPMRELLDGVCLLIAGVLLLTGGNSEGDGSSAFVQAEAALTVTITPESTAPPTPTPTALPPTATEPLPTEPLPTVAPPTSPPALAPPPPKPENAAVAEIGTVAGGQWYVLQTCVSFYLPGGYTFVIRRALNDPGGFNSIAFLVFGTESVVSSVGFHADTAQELSRNAREVSLGPVFDQIAATISRDC